MRKSLPVWPSETFLPHRILPILAGMFVLVALAGCSNPFSQNTPPVEPFYPPTRLPTTIPTPVVTEIPTGLRSTAESAESTPTPECTNRLSFAADLSIPDGTVVRPGEELEKRWQVRNSGTCNWDNSYRIKLIAGPELGAPAEQALFPARSGTEAKIRILFIAPDESGTYRSAWQAVDPTGQLFGDPFFIEIVVTAES